MNIYQIIVQVIKNSYEIIFFNYFKEYRLFKMLYLNNKIFFLFVYVCYDFIM